jgi:type IV pilus assembly protein PilV
MHRTRFSTSFPEREKGATLIEILVSLLILSFGVLGMAGLQARALKGNQSAMQRTQAVMMSYYILDAMRVDSNSAKSLAYNTGSVTGTTIGPMCNPAAITGTTLAQNNLKHWIQSLKTTIGKTGDTTTCGAVLCDADGVCQIQVSWDDSRAGGMGAQIINTHSKL